MSEHTGLRPVDFLWSLTSEVRLIRGARSGGTWRDTCNHLAGSRPAFLHRYFFAPSLFSHFIRQQYNYVTQIQIPCLCYSYLYISNNGVGFHKDEDDFLNQHMRMSASKVILMTTQGCRHCIWHSPRLK